MLRCLSFAACAAFPLRRLLAATLCLFTLSTAHAIEIVIDDPLRQGGGFIGASAASSMSGTGIPFNTVVGTEADGTVHDPLACVSCFATFHTGATAGSGEPSGFSLHGSVTGMGGHLVMNDTLFEADQFAVEVLTVDPLGASAAARFTFVVGAGQGQLHSALASHFRVPIEMLFDIGFSAILRDASEPLLGSELTSNVASADIVLTPSVAMPQPAPLGLLALGLLAAGVWSARGRRVGRESQPR